MEPGLLTALAAAALLNTWGDPVPASKLPEWRLQVSAAAEPAEDVERPGRKWAKYALVGGSAGGVVGGLIGSITGTRTCALEGGCETERHTLEGALIGAGLGAALGVLIGLREDQLTP